MSDVPITRPDELLALHEVPYGHSTTWVQLEDGRILMFTGGGSFRTSDDGGLSWSEPFPGSLEGGGELQRGDTSLVRLNDGAIGLAGTQRSSSHRGDVAMVFHRSEDGGRTWSQPIRMNSHLPAYALQDVFLRTSSGRLVLPVYGSCGQGTPRAEDAPVPGAYLNGRFMATDAHYVDAHFSFCYVLYSDDDGKTWGQCAGELLIKMAYNGTYEYANEPSVAEVAPGKLIMMVRNRLGRLFSARSEDDGTTWTRLQPTPLASSTAPAQIRRVPANGHLLVVWNQENDEEIRRGMIRTRISSAISRNGGDMWEFHQNIESILDGAFVEPGPICPTMPEGMYDDHGRPALVRDRKYIAPLPSNMGRWSYPSVLVLDDRVLVAHTYSVYENADKYARGSARIKVFPLSWFYGGADPLADDIRTNWILEKIWKAAQP